MNTCNKADFVNWTRGDTLWGFKQLWRETHKAESLETFFLESNQTWVEMIKGMEGKDFFLGGKD